MSDLKNKFLNGVIWTGVRRFGEQSLQTITTIILARLLSPHEFGVVGIANIFILFANTINNLGISAALIHRKDIDEGHLSSAFWANMGTGAILCLIMMGLSYPAAKFFNNPQVQPVLFTFSFIFILGALKIVQDAQFSREFKFGKIAAINVWEMFINSVISISLAWRGWGVWSLVWGRLIGVGFGAAMMWAQSTWKPQLRFSAKKFRELFRFGVYTLSTNVLTYLGQNFDYILVGRFLGVEPLGVYTMAYNLITLPRRKMSTVISSVAFPVFSRIQDDTARVARNYLKVIRYISFATFPALTGLMVICPLLVHVVLSPKWEATIVPVQIMCVLGMYSSISTTVGSIFYAMGRPDLELKTDIAQLAGLVCFLMVGVKYGINGVAVAVTLMAVVSKPFIFHIIARLLHIRLRDVYGASFWAFFSSFMMAGIMISVDYVFRVHLMCSEWMRFIVLLLVGAGSYWGLQILFKINTLSEVYEIFRSNMTKTKKIASGV